MLQTKKKEKGKRQKQKATEISALAIAAPKNNCYLANIIVCYFYNNNDYNNNNIYLPLVNCLFHIHLVQTYLTVSQPKSGK